MTHLNPKVFSGKAWIDPGNQSTFVKVTVPFVGKLYDLKSTFDVPGDMSLRLIAESCFQIEGIFFLSSSPNMKRRKIFWCQEDTDGSEIYALTNHIDHAIQKKNELTINCFSRIGISHAIIHRDLFRLVSLT